MGFILCLIDSYIAGKDEQDKLVCSQHEGLHSLVGIPLDLDSLGAFRILEKGIQDMDQGTGGILHQKIFKI